VDITEILVQRLHAWEVSEEYAARLTRGSGFKDFQMYHAPKSSTAQRLRICGMTLNKDILKPPIKTFTLN